MNNEYCMIEVAFDSKLELEKSIKELLSKKLVASCQVVNSESSWNWNNELETSKEYLVFMKTRKSLAKEIYEIIKEIHSYECFEFAIFDLTSCSKKYLNWLETEINK